MKKQFKLIKQYPDSGVELEEVLTFSDGITEIQKHTDGDEYWVYAISDIENFPEFWEKIEETEKLCVPIGTKFTIGTTIYSIENAPYLGKYRIDYKTGYVDMSVRDINASFANGSWKVYIEKPVLFVTEDGKEIREGDVAYECARNGKFYSVINKFTPMESCKSSYVEIGKTWVVFSTKEAAQEYIDMNKPIYSKKQAIAMIRQFDKELTACGDLDDSEYIPFLL